MDQRRTQEAHIHSLYRKIVPYRTGRLKVSKGTPAKVDAMHHVILREAGKAKVRPGGK